MTNTKVESIDADALTLVSQGKEQKHSQTVAYGACVWATGVAMHPLTHHLQQAMPPGTQSHSRCYMSRFTCSYDAAEPHKSSALTCGCFQLFCDS